MNNDKISIGTSRILHEGEVMSDHEYTTHPTYTGLGCARCGKDHGEAEGQPAPPYPARAAAVEELVKAAQKAAILLTDDGTGFETDSAYIEECEAVADEIQCALNRWRK